MRLRIFWLILFFSQAALADFAEMRRRVKQMEPDAVRGLRIALSIQLPSISRGSAINREQCKQFLSDYEEKTGQHPFASTKYSSGRVGYSFDCREDDKYNIDYFLSQRSGSSIFGQSVLYELQEYRVRKGGSSGFDWTVFRLSQFGGVVESIEKSRWSPSYSDPVTFTTVQTVAPDDSIYGRWFSTSTKYKGYFNLKYCSASGELHCVKESRKKLFGEIYHEREYEIAERNWDHYEPLVFDWFFADAKYTYGSKFHWYTDDAYHFRLTQRFEQNRVVCESGKEYFEDGSEKKHAKRGDGC